MSPIAAMVNVHLALTSPNASMRDVEASYRPSGIPRAE